MAIFKGKTLTVEIFGESHSEYIGGRMFGLCDSEIDFDLLKEFISERKADSGVYSGVYSTSRCEKDQPIFKGLDNGKINGEFSFIIKNENVEKKDYADLYGKPRPSHADYAWHLKDGALDFSGGGRFSGRLTAALCVVGGICKQYLAKKGVNIIAYVSKTGAIDGKSYKNAEKSDYQTIKKLRAGKYPSLSEKEKMLEEIAQHKKAGDSVGGKIECIVYGYKAGVGDNLFGGIESKISSLIYAVPAVKGVEFGLGFDFSASYGSIVNDELYYDDQKNVKFRSNNSGGINGGITNGEEITIGVAIRPTPSISKMQNTVDLIKKENCKIKIEGRHDGCIVPRAVPCIESAVAIALLDEIGGE